MTRQYNEQAYHDASQQTKDHRQLHQTDSSRKMLMSMPRKVHRSIWRLNMRCQTYSQLTTGLPLRCRWCDWLRHCRAIGYWQKLMTVRLNEDEAHLDDREITIAILNSQNTVAYEEITGLVRNFLLHEPNL